MTVSQPIENLSKVMNSGTNSHMTILEKHILKYNLDMQPEKQSENRSLKRELAPPTVESKTKKKKKKKKQKERIRPHV